MAHGGQQGVLFNGFYDTWCYLPMFGFLSVFAGDRVLSAIGMIRDSVIRCCSTNCKRIEKPLHSRDSVRIQVFMARAFFCRMMLYKQTTEKTRCAPSRIPRIISPFNCQA